MAADRFNERVAGSSSSARAPCPALGVEERGTPETAKEGKLEACL